MTDLHYKIKSALFGVAIGDALGVPVEFKSRAYLGKNPVTDMMGYGTYNQRPGTFSDDSSMTFCLAEALTKDFYLHEIAQNFVKWRDENFWSARGELFDIGIATNQAIERISAGVQSEFAGSIDHNSNGNGSLMRILPLLFYTQGLPISDRYEITKKVSSITHGHIRSVIACFYYLEFARELLSGKDKFEIYKNLQAEVPYFLKSLSINLYEISLFDRLLKDDISDLKEDEISSSGYVLHTLEASIWCLLTTDNYKYATLKAVNLGEDTDSTAAVLGGLVGLLYGFDSIPESWVEQLARKDDIADLSERLTQKILNNKKTI